MSEPPDTAFLGATDQWLEAALWLGLTLRVSGGTEAQWGAPHLLHLSRLQFACELAFHRIGAASEAADSKDSRTAMGGVGRLYLEIHMFLVSAHAYWRTLRQLNRLLKLPAFSAAVQANEAIAAETKTARDHLEHMYERIEKGRPPKYGEMTARTFRGAMGRFDGTQVTFGNESFRLGDIHAAVCRVGREVAPLLRQAATPILSVRTTEPANEEGGS